LDPVVQRATEAVEPVTESVVEPVTERVTESVVEPVAERVVEPVTEAAEPVRDIVTGVVESIPDEPVSSTRDGGSSSEESADSSDDDRSSSEESSDSGSDDRESGTGGGSVREAAESVTSTAKSLLGD
jgi:hypothetical protein